MQHAPCPSGINGAFIAIKFIKSMLSSPLRTHSVHADGGRRMVLPRPTCYHSELSPLPKLYAFIHLIWL